MIKLAPSILTADFTNLESEIKKIEENGCPYLHVDVMDGHFVPNISIGAPVVKSIRKVTNMVLDVHLMISEPLKYVKDFADAGSDIINFHIECDNDTNEVIDEILKYGKKAGITVKPNTPITDVFPFLDRLSMVLIMSVEPGFGGQKFMEDMMEKVAVLKKHITENNLEIDIEVDGGLNMSNIDKALDKGANVVVVGSGIYNDNGADKNTVEYINYFKEYVQR